LFAKYSDFHFQSEPALKVDLQIHCISWTDRVLLLLAVTRLKVNPPEIVAKLKNALTIFFVQLN